MECHIARLTKEDTSVNKKFKLSTLLIAAAIIAVIAGTAVAAGTLGIFDFIKDTANPIIPLDGAEEMVLTDLGVSESELAVLTVEEAVFDGQGVLVKCRIAPKDTKKYAMFNSFMLDAPQDDYIVESVPVEFGKGSTEEYSEDGVLTVTNMSGNPELLLNGEPIDIPVNKEAALEKGLPVYLNNGTLYYADFCDTRVLGRKDGRKIIECWTDVSVGDDLIIPDNWDAQAQEDGSIVWWQSGIAYDVIDVDSIEVRVSARLYEGDKNEGAEPVVNELSFTLPRSGDERFFSIVPAGDSKGERFEILSGSITFTRVRGYLRVNYTYEQADVNEEMGITFNVYDADGDRITTGAGDASAEADENGVQWWSMEMQPFSEVPERIWLEAKVIGWDKTLGRVECKLAES